MSQQLAIMVMIDVEAALESGTLSGNIHLIDNNRWLGSRGEGSDRLTSVVRVARIDGVVDAQVLNWLCGGVGDLPADLPADHLPEPVDGALVELRHRPPELIRITGEALDQGVIFPARYGSPNPLDDGLYWSATVNPSMRGEYRYTMHFALLPPIIGDEPAGEPVVLTHDARIDIVEERIRDGFAALRRSPP